MFKNYMLIAIRNIRRHVSFSVLNILGLSIGIASFMIILLYIQYELSFNKHIDNIENKYRLVEIQTEPGVGEQHVAVTMGPMAEALQREYPEIKSTMRIMCTHGRTVRYEDKSFNENWFAFADSTVFDMLNVNLLMGDKKTALKELNSIILSEKLARKYFGSPEKAMDNMLTVTDETFIVKGIMEDYPENSTVYFKALMPFKTIAQRYESLRNWGSNSVDTYLELQSSRDKSQLEDKLPEFSEKYVSESWGSPLPLYIQPMKDIHLKSGHIKFQIYNYQQGDINQVYIFSAIALLILIVACINYINLATSLALRRSKEVGVRKVVGANKQKIIYQLLGESFVIVIISAILALGGISLFLPVVNQILGLELTMSIGNPLFSLGLIGTMIVVGFISGLYPALYMSGFRPTVIFSGFRSSRGKSKSVILRKTLVITQFSVSIIIIIATIIAISQVRFFQKQDKGYNDEAVYTIPLRFPDDKRIKNTELLISELKNQADIKAISATSSPTGVSGSQGAIFAVDSSEAKLMTRFGYFDPEYLPLMDIKIIQGRNFSDEYAMDKYQGLILNEIAVQKLGWDNPIGKQFRPKWSDSTNYTVIGVIQDYNYYSLRSPIEPAAYWYRPERFGQVNIKLNTTDLQSSVNAIKDKWSSLFPSTPFDGYFMNERYEQIYSNEINTTKIFGIFASLCIFISCLGLFGLISFVVNQKTKEIAIRKVFGSDVKKIVAVISKEFIMLVLIASLIGIPVAYHYMGQWLNNFAYKISLSWYYFLIAVILAVIIAFLTIIYRAVSAARTNPAQALRDE